MQGDHRWNVEAAGDNCGMRGGAAKVSDEARESVAAELNDVGGGQVMGNKNAVLFRGVTRQDLTGTSHEHLQDALHDLDDVSLAIAQVAVFNAFKLLDQRIHLQLEGPFRVALQGFDQLLGRFRQSRVVENHEVHIQERLKF